MGLHLEKSPFIKREKNRNRNMNIFLTVFSIVGKTRSQLLGAQIKKIWKIRRNDQMFLGEVSSVLFSPFNRKSFNGVHGFLFQSRILQSVHIKA